MEEETGGVSLAEVCRVILKKIWIVLGVSVLFAIVLGLVFMFGINPTKEQYSMEFRIIYPTSELEKFPDGAPFFHDDIISLTSLDKAKASSEKFSSVNVEQMIQKDDISIAAETETIDAVKRYTGRYTVTVKGSYFKNKTMAEEFIGAIASVCVNNIKENAEALEYGIDESYFRIASFEERIALLKNKKDELLAHYDRWIAEYDSLYVVEGKTLENHKEGVIVVYGESVQSSLAEEFETNGYHQLDINSHQGEEDIIQKAIDARVEELKSEMALNQTIIDELKDALQYAVGPQGVNTYAANTGRPVDVSSLSEMLAHYIKRNAQIAYQIGDGTTQGTLTKDKVEAFSARLDGQYEAISALCGILKKVSASIYDNGTNALFDSRKATSSGDTSLALIVVGGFVAAFLVSAVVVYYVETNKKKKAAKRVEDGDHGEEKKE